MLQEEAQCVRLGEVGAAVKEEPRWGCNNRVIVARSRLIVNKSKDEARIQAKEALTGQVKQLRFVVRGVQEPTNESVPE